MNETDLLARITARLAPLSTALRVPPGLDDCGALDWPGGLVVASADMLLEGTHFRASDAGYDVGWKTLAVNLSDMAASGCRPQGALVTAGFGRGTGSAWIEAFLDGLATCAEEYACPLLGGDITSSHGPAAFSGTVLGVPLRETPVLRGGARPGNRIGVTGALGGSIRGRHLHPLPRLREIEALLMRTDIHAAMDISDGLALDLSRMMTQSGCGAILEAGAIPIHADAEIEARGSGRSPLDHALGDGEDFELLVCLEPEACAAMEINWPEDLAPVTWIGEVTANAALQIRNPDGTVAPLAITGFVHPLTGDKDDG